MSQQSHFVSRSDIHGVESMVNAFDFLENDEDIFVKWHPQCDKNMPNEPVTALLTRKTFMRVSRLPDNKALFGFELLKDAQKTTDSHIPSRFVQARQDPFRQPIYSECDLRCYETLKSYDVCKALLETSPFTDILGGEQVLWRLDMEVPGGFVFHALVVGMEEQRGANSLVITEFKSGADAHDRLFDTLDQSSLTSVFVAQEASTKLSYVVQDGRLTDDADLLQGLHLALQTGAYCDTTSTKYGLFSNGNRYIVVSCRGQTLSISKSFGWKEDGSALAGRVKPSWLALSLGLAYQRAIKQDTIFDADEDAEEQKLEAPDFAAMFLSVGTVSSSSLEMVVSNC